MSGFPWPTSRVQVRQTSKQVVVQRCGLTSDSNAAPRPRLYLGFCCVYCLLFGLPHQPTPDKSQYMWTLKMDAPRIRLFGGVKSKGNADERGPLCTWRRRWLAVPTKIYQRCAGCQTERCQDRALTALGPGALGKAGPGHS
jgi:hypothetical protein